MARARAKSFSAQTQLRVGRLLKAHGLKGGIKLELYTDDPDRRFVPGASFALQVPDESPWSGKRIELTELRWYNQHPVAFFADVADRTTAESLLRAILWVDQDPAEPAEPDAWYDHQLTGLDVVRDGVVVGVIDRLEHLPAQDLLVVRAGDREVLVPFVRAIVPEVDVAGGRVLVTPPVGLFEEQDAVDAVASADDPGEHRAAEADAPDAAAAEPAPVGPGAVAASPAAADQADPGSTAPHGVTVASSAADRA